MPSSFARAASNPGVRSVRVMPGWTQLTVMPWRPSCTASVLVRCTSEVLRAPPLRLPALRAFSPLMLMMRPQRSRFMNGITARAQRSAPTYFTSKSRIRSSSTTLSMGPVAVAEPPGAEPLLIRMWRPPSASAARATIASTWARLVTSATRAITRRPVSVASSRAAASSRSLVRATSATSTPSRASSRAMALPMPRLPPVTIARLPWRPSSIDPLPWVGAPSEGSPLPLQLSRCFQRCFAQAVDEEADAVARCRELGGDAAARHQDHVAVETAAARVEQVGEPGHRLDGMAHGVTRLALALGPVVDPAARDGGLEIDGTPVAAGAEHHAAVPGVLRDQ